jgi:hypothetical protein
MTRVRVYAKDGRSIMAEFRFARLYDEGLVEIARYAQCYGCGAYYLEAFPIELEARYP